MLLLFDIDGTLCNTQPHSDRCFIETFETIYQCKLGKINWGSFEHVTDSGLHDSLFRRQFDREATGDETTYFKEKYFQNLKLISHTFREVNGSNQFLFNCKKNEIPIAIATGNWDTAAQIKLQHSKIECPNIPICTSDFSFDRKLIMLNAIEQAEIFYSTPKFNKVIYFGDGIWDYESSLKLGIHFIGIDIDNNQQLTRTNTQLIIPNFENAMQIMEHINSVR